MVEPQQRFQRFGRIEFGGRGSAVSCREFERRPGSHASIVGGMRLRVDIAVFIRIASVNRQYGGGKTTYQPRDCHRNEHPASFQPHDDRHRALRGGRRQGAACDEDPAMVLHRCTTVRLPSPIAL